MFNQNGIFFYNYLLPNSKYNKNSFYFCGCWSDIVYTSRVENILLFLVPKKLKVDLTGKVFKWKSGRFVWDFSVHYSHISHLLFKSSLFFFKKSGKNKYTLFSKKLYTFFFLKKFLKKIRYSDLFTNRGLKYEPRSFLKKQGKISTYV